MAGLTVAPGGCDSVLATLDEFLMKRRSRGSAVKAAERSRQWVGVPATSDSSRFSSS